jgi:leucyl-tRNA synthetase
MKKWEPVTSYIGGKEHAVLHLLYARFITMVFYDLGYLDFDEPFKKFIAHGLITKDGAKMSKSKGNVVNPDEYIAKYGADSIRMYLRFLGSFDQGGDWKDDGMQGMYKFVNRIWNCFMEEDFGDVRGMDEDKLMSLADSVYFKTVKKVGEDINNLKFNTAVAALMQFFNWYTEEKGSLSKEMKWFYLKNISLVLAPLMPHLAEEFWTVITGNKESVHIQKWPTVLNEKLEDSTINLPIQVNGKVRGTVEMPIGLTQEEVEQRARGQENVAKYLEGKSLIKVIYVKDKILNFLIK